MFDVLRDRREILKNSEHFLFKVFENLNDSVTID